MEAAEEVVEGATMEAIGEPWGGVSDSFPNFRKTTRSYTCGLSAELISRLSQGLLLIMALQWCNGCGIDDLDTREGCLWRWRGQAQAI